jgi:hypothetical protein
MPTIQHVKGKSNQALGGLVAGFLGGYSDAERANRDLADQERRTDLLEQRQQAAAAQAQAQADQEARLLARMEAIVGGAPPSFGAGGEAGPEPSEGSVPAGSPVSGGYLSTPEVGRDWHDARLDPAFLMQAQAASPEVRRQMLALASVTATEARKGAFLKAATDLSNRMMRAAPEQDMEGIQTLVMAMAQGADPETTFKALQEKQSAWNAEIANQQAAEQGAQRLEQLYVPILDTVSHGTAMRIRQAILELRTQNADPTKTENAIRRMLASDALTESMPPTSDGRNSLGHQLSQQIEGLGAEKGLDRDMLASIQEAEQLTDTQLDTGQILSQIHQDADELNAMRGSGEEPAHPEGPATQVGQPGVDDGTEVREDGGIYRNGKLLSRVEQDGQILYLQPKDSKGMYRYTSTKPKRKTRSKKGTSSKKKTRRGKRR